MSISNLGATVTDVVQLAVTNYMLENQPDQLGISESGLVDSRTEITPSGEGATGKIRYYTKRGNLRYAGDTGHTSSLMNMSDDVWFNRPTDDPTDSATLSGNPIQFANYIKGVYTVVSSAPDIHQLLELQPNQIEVHGQRALVDNQINVERHIYETLNGIARNEIALGGGMNQGIRAAQLGRNTTSTQGFYFETATQAANPIVSTDTGLIWGAGTAGNAEPGFRLTPLLRAIAWAWGTSNDREPLYLVTDEVEYGKLTEANLIGREAVEDGNITFDTILNGRVRLIVAPFTFDNLGTETQTNTASTKTSFLVRSGGFAYRPLPELTRFRIAQEPLQGNAGGVQYSIAQNGFVLVPKGYSWAGSTAATIEDPQDLNVAASWTKRVSGNSHYILPILHE